MGLLGPGCLLTDRGTERRPPNNLELGLETHTLSIVLHLSADSNGGSLTWRCKLADSDQPARLGEEVPPLVDLSAPRSDDSLIFEVFMIVTRIALDNSYKKEVGKVRARSSTVCGRLVSWRS